MVSLQSNQQRLSERHTKVLLKMKPRNGILTPSCEVLQVRGDSSAIVLYKESKQVGRDEQVWLQEQHKPNQPWAAALLLSSCSVWAARCICSLVLQLKNKDILGWQC